MNNLSPAAYLGSVLIAAAATGVQAQSYCSSDGVTRPTALLERFIDADCQQCWGDSRTVRPRRGELALDWIVPSTRGDAAALSAAAARDSLARLQSLGRKAPERSDAARARTLTKPMRTLRVAHGLPFNGYIGTSIELKPGTGAPWKAWLLLVETIPAGVEGTPVERNLVRNALELAWTAQAAGGKLFEARPMSIPEGVKPDRLRMVGWVEDAKGQIGAIAQSRCAPAAGQG